MRVARLKALRLTRTDEGWAAYGFFPDGAHAETMLCDDDLKRIVEVLCAHTPVNPVTIAMGDSMTVSTRDEYTTVVDIKGDTGWMIVDSPRLHKERWVALASVLSEQPLVLYTCDKKTLAVEDEEDGEG